MDEAVLRIVMQDAGTGAQPSAPGTSPAPPRPASTQPYTPAQQTVSTQPHPTPVPPQPTSPKPKPPKLDDDSSDYDPTNPKHVARRQLDQEEFKAQVETYKSNMREPKLPSLPITSKDVALKKAELAKFNAEVQDYFNELVPIKLKTKLTAREFAVKKAEAVQYNKEVEEYFNKLVPIDVEKVLTARDVAAKKAEGAVFNAEVQKYYNELIPPDSPAEAAKKKLDAAEKKEAEDAEYDKIRRLDVVEVKPPFDPVVEANKRHEAERRKAQVDAAYRSQYGDDRKGPLDHVFKVVDSLRGTIGGVLGTTVGAMLDVVSSVRNVWTEVAKARRNQDLLQDVGGGTGPSPPGATAPRVPTVHTPPVAPAPGRAAGTAATAVGVVNAGSAVSKAAGTATAATAGAATKGAATAASAAAATGAATAAPAVVAGASAAGPIGTAAATAIVVIGAAAAAVLHAVTRLLDKEADKYTEYSPEVAHAQAIAEIRQVMGDLRRSKEITPELSRYIMAQSDMQQKFEDIKVKLLVKILPVVTKVLEHIEVLMKAGESVAGVINVIAEPLVVMARVLGEMLGLQKEPLRPDPIDPTEQLLNDRNFNEGGAFVPDL